MQGFTLRPNQKGSCPSMETKVKSGVKIYILFDTTILINFVKKIITREAGVAYDRIFCIFDAE
jgi:hypothetical protein